MSVLSANTKDELAAAAAAAVAANAARREARRDWCWHLFMQTVLFVVIFALLLFHW